MKKKWYRKTAVKGIWVVIMHLSAAVAALCMAVALLMYSQGFLLWSKGEFYLESTEFSDQVFNTSYEIVQAISENERFSVHRQQTGREVIDLQEILDGTELTYENTSGLAYSAENLEKWAQSTWNHGGNVLVCTRPGGKTEYYYYDELKKLFQDRKLQFDMDEDFLRETGIREVDAEREVWQYLEYQQMIDRTLADEGIEAVVNGDGEVEFVDICNYPEMSIVEKYPPENADSLLDVVNNNPNWQGRLTQANQALAEALDRTALIRNISSRNAEILETYREGGTNLTYLYVNKETQTVYTNKSDYENYKTYEAALKEMTESEPYVAIYSDLSKCTAAMKADVQFWHHMLGDAAASDDFIFAVQVDKNLPVDDYLAQTAAAFGRYREWRMPVIQAGAVSLLLLAVGLVWLTVVAGQKTGDEEIHLCWFDGWFTEISAGLVLGIWLAGMGSVFFGFVNNTFTDGELCATAAVLGVFSISVFLVGYLSLVRRIKAKILWKNSLLCWIFTKFGKLGGKNGIWSRILRNLKKVPGKIRSLAAFYSRNTGSKIKMTFLFGGFLVAQAVLFSAILNGRNSILEISSVLLLALDGAAMVYFLKKADGREKILEGLKRISGGELTYKIQEDRLYGEQKTIAEYINRIGEGLDAAVEKSVKNERMKTELITNVSHDLKTPLTSIINYVDLLKRENFTDARIRGYINVLEEKAHRLKVLTEDVVEASKASTGNITLEKTELDFVEMVHQVIGEFEEKMQSQKLTLVTGFTDEPAVIFADGQRLWRVLENIFNNVVKYAMEGTRVYAEVKREQDKICFYLKNISAQPLNISADELTERFIRGDVSRNTEGSGLGLSIAKSLTLLQGGEFNLYLDGDLFKVLIAFPVNKE